MTLDVFEDHDTEIQRISEEINKDLVEIASLQGTNAKKDRLALVTEQTREAFRLHLDPFTKFGVSKLSGTPTGTGIPWDTVFNLLRDGKGRDLSKISDRMDELQFKIVNGIFDGFKKWKPGVKGGSFLDVFPGSYRTFAVQLCSTWDEAEFEQGSFAQTKFDGIRCASTVDYDSNVFFLSRNGKPVNQIADWVEMEMQKFPGWVFDSETHADHMHFQKNSGIAKRKNSEEKLVLKIFDLIEYDSFLVRSYDVPYIIRYQMLRELLKDSPLLHLVAEHEEVQTVDEAIDFYERQRANKQEGAIVKKRNSLYNFDRNPDWQKVKPLETIECRIVAYHEGTPDTKHVGRLGAISVIDHTGAISRVGSGWSDKERQRIWDERDELGEAIVEIKFMERTSGSGVFRHSRFGCFRLDKDDINPTGA
jgi:hypothetical protein